MPGPLMNRRDLLALAAGTYAGSAIAGRSSGGEAVADALARFVRSYMRTMGAPGLTLGLAGADGPLLAQAYGLVDVAARTPVTTAHLFEIGSISKSFAAVMLLQLQQEGRLAVDHDITRYLPWLPIETPYGPIQIHHLLTHSAGLPDDEPLLPEQPGQRYRQAFAPGTRFHYSNFGYGVLGHLIEKLDGRTWELALRKRILEPLGMTNTAPTLVSTVRQRIAQSYVPQEDDRPYRRGAALVPAGNVTWTTASGCIASTPLDMARYMAMFIRRGAGPKQRILQEASFKTLATPHLRSADFGPHAGYGYGFAIDQLDGHTILLHTGGMVSFMSAIWIDLDAGFGAFASINAMQEFRPNAVARYALQLLRARQERESPPQPPSADETAIAETADFEGNYLSERGERLEVTSANGALLLLINGKQITLRHREEERFKADDPEFALFPWVFGRALEGSTSGTTQKKKESVIELSWGPRWYGGRAIRMSPPLKAASPCWVMSDCTIRRTVGQAARASLSAAVVFGSMARSPSTRLVNISFAGQMSRRAPRRPSSSSS